MRIDVMKGGKVDSVEELQEQLESTLAKLNGVKSAQCWICGEVVQNWGFLFPDGSEDALGFGAKEIDGKKQTRLALFPFCPEHDLEDEEIIEKVNRTLQLMRSQLLN